MFDRKSLKKALICTTSLMGGILLPSASALASSCPSVILGTELSGEICDFNANSSITVASGGEVGGINQSSYNPLNSFIINNGTISNDEAAGINLNNASSLSNGIINNGIIFSGADSTMSGIAINNASTVSGGVINNGTITSGSNFGFQLDNDSVVNGDITNGGSILSNSINNPAMLIRADSVVNGDINNGGIIRAYGDGDGFYMGDGGIINGNINNSGIIRGYSGLDLRVDANLTGNITNNSTIIGDTDSGINVTQGGVVNGNIINTSSITGNINGISIDNNGTVNGGITNQAGATISGDVGIYINDVSTVNGNINNYGTITGGTNSIYVSNDSIATNINIYDGSVINGDIDAVNSTVNISGGEINGAISAGAVNINSVATFNMNYDITGAVVNAGTLAIGNTTRTINGDYTQSAGGTLKINAQDATNYGQLVATNDVILADSGKIDVVINAANIKAGTRLNNVIVGAGLEVPTSGFSVTDNSQLLSFTATVNDNGVNLLAVDDANTSVSKSAAGNRGSAGAASKLDEIIALNQSGDSQNIISALNSLGSAQQVANAVSQTTPALTGATNNATINNMNTTMRIVQARQQSNSGFSSGEDFHTNRDVWMKTFGSWGNQGNKSGVVGYKSNAYGLVTGADKAIDNKTRAGVAVSYFNSKFTSNNNINQVNVDSFLGIAYGSYNLNDKTEVNAQVAAGYNSSNSSRSINFGGLNRTAKGSYDGWNFHAGTGISRLVKLDSATTIAPQFRVDYFTVSNQGYNESGAGVLDLHIASQTQAQLIPAAEVAANHKFTSRISLALNAGLGYDLLNRASTVSASFAGGGGEFITRGLNPSPWVVRSGAGLTWKRSDEVDFTARYDRNDRGNYDNQTVSLKLRVMF